MLKTLKMINYSSPIIYYIHNDVTANVSFFGSGTSLYTDRWHHMYIQQSNYVIYSISRKSREHVSKNDNLDNHPMV